MTAPTVTLVCPSYPPQPVTCGVGDYTRCLAEEIGRHGADVRVLASSAYAGDGRPVPVVPLGEWRLGALVRLLASWRTPHHVVHLQYTPDLYARRPAFVMLPLLARLAARRLRSVVTFHTLTGGSAWSKVAALALMTASGVISANEEVTAMIRRRLPALGHRVTEIPIGSSIPVAAGEPADRTAGRERLGVRASAPLLVHFGLVYPGKGVETLLEALRELVRVLPDARLVMLGDTGPGALAYRASLADLAARLGVDGAVVWAGRRSAEETSRVLQCADVFVLPYDGGVSIRRSTLVAGLAHGLPIVSTRSALPSAYLKDGENVMLVPPRDPHALAGRLVSVLTARADAARLGQAARALAERFAWPRIATETLAAYERVLAR